MSKLVTGSASRPDPERPGTAEDDPRKEERGAIHVYFANGDVVVGWWECVLISIWKRDQWSEYARLRGQAGEQLAKERAGPLALLTLVLETAGLPDEPTLKALAQLRLTPSHRRVVACAGIAEGAPIRVAGARALSISLDQLVPPPFPTKMFGSRVDAVLWILDALSRAGVTSLRGRELLAGIAREAR